LGPERCTVQLLRLAFIMTAIRICFFRSFA